MKKDNGEIFYDLKSIYYKKEKFKWLTRYKYLT